MPTVIKHKIIAIWKLLHPNDRVLRRGFGFIQKLVVQKIGGDFNTDKWTMKDYLNGDLELVQINRRAGANDVGMVAWVVTLKTVEYPNVSTAFFVVV